VSCRLLEKLTGGPDSEKQNPLHMPGFLFELRVHNLSGFKMVRHVHASPVFHV
jgi:hypothetical protein